MNKRQIFKVFHSLKKPLKWNDLRGFYFLGAIPAIRSNLLCRTPAQKDFRCTRAKRTVEAIGAKS
jgi:hypothetical protein